MLFNSLAFLIFLPIVFIGYWFVFSKTKSSQNIFLLLASYFFYSFWNWHFLFLLIFSTFLDYSTGIAIGNTPDIKMKKLWLCISLFINIGLLCYFKYCNFFIDSFTHGMNLLGLHLSTWSLKIILPIGISFYTFHGISYIIDIYYDRIKPHRNFFDYALFVSYFPLLVAGPIERATHLLPQLKQKRNFDHAQAIAGMRLILWGMFKKIVIADSLGLIVNNVFSNYNEFNAATLIIGVIAFSIQIYGDFSGYTDIARGVSKLFGIDLIKNFNFPYFSKNIAEFWSRWHISLSSWLNDYVFTPLALNFRYNGKNGISLSILLTFIISGFWHGAGWHFVIWGVLNGCYYLPIVYSKKGIKSMVSKKYTDIHYTDTGKFFLTYTLVCFSFIFFRAESTRLAFSYIRRIAVSSIKSPTQFLHIPYGIAAFAYIIPFLLADLWMRTDDRKLILKYPLIEKVASWVLVILIILSFQKETTFIYFKF